MELKVSEADGHVLAIGVDLELAAVHCKSPRQVVGVRRPRVSFTIKSSDGEAGWSESNLHITECRAQRAEVLRSDAEANASGVLGLRLWEAGLGLLEAFAPLVDALLLWFLLKLLGSWLGIAEGMDLVDTRMDLAAVLVGAFGAGSHATSFRARLLGFRFGRGSFAGFGGDLRQGPHRLKICSRSRKPGMPLRNFN